MNRPSFQSDFCALRTDLERSCRHLCFLYVLVDHRDRDGLGMGLDVSIELDPTGTVAKDTIWNQAGGSSCFVRMPASV